MLAPLRNRRQRYRALFSRLAIGVIVLCSASAWAQEKRTKPVTSSLSWIRLAGAEECISTQELARAVEQRLGRTVFVSPAQADVSIEGHIVPDTKQPGWNATIVLRDTSGAALGKRNLHEASRSCGVMRESLALVIAVMIDPDAPLGGSRPPESSTARSTPEPASTSAPAGTPKAAEVVPVEEKPEVDKASRPEPWRFDGGAALTGGLGLLPNPALGLRAEGLVEPPRFVALQVLGAVWLDNTAAAEGSGRGTFSLAFAGAGICPLRWRGERFSAYVCGHGQLGVIKSHGTAFDLPRPDEQKLYFAGALDGRLSIRVLGPLAIRAGVTAVVPLLRDTFVYRRADGSAAELFRMAPIAAAGDVGLGVVLP